MAGKGRPFPKGHKGPGRPKGVPNKLTVEVREIARNLLEDEGYIKALQIRLLRGTAGQVEPLLWHYAYGKPKETLEMGGPESAISVTFGGRYKPPADA